MKVKVEAAGLKMKVEFLERELDRIKSKWLWNTENIFLFLLSVWYC
jgi:hypothetical protein